MLSVYKTKKFAPAALICLSLLLQFGQARSAIPGCVVFGVIYHNQIVSGTAEVYGRESYRRISGDVDCSLTFNQNLSYVKTDDITPRTGVTCRATIGNGLANGTPVQFNTVYQCPVDDYIPYILLMLLPMAFYFFRKQLAI